MCITRDVLNVIQDLTSDLKDIKLYTVQLTRNKE